jgi:hypothetical protein
MVSRSDQFYSEYDQVISQAKLSYIPNKNRYDEILHFLQEEAEVTDGQKRTKKLTIEQNKWKHKFE